MAGGACHERVGSRWDADVLMNWTLCTDNVLGLVKRGKPDSQVHTLSNFKEDHPASGLIGLSGLASTFYDKVFRCCT